MARLANRKKYQNKRENFMQLYNTTCESVFKYAFELCLNHNDALLVCREAYMNMYSEISSLRIAPSVDYWQRKYVSKAFRKLARKGKITLIHEKSVNDPSDDILLEEKEDMWKRINRTADIDPWRLIPTPRKSTIFSVMADKLVSDFSYMTFTDKPKVAAAILVAVSLLGGGGFCLYYFVLRDTSGTFDDMEEIFLDERSYSDYDIDSSVQVTDEDVYSEIYDAFGGLDDEAGLSSSVLSRSTAGDPIYTDSEEINEQLIAIVDEVVDSSMNDTELLWALYKYVGENIVYADVSDTSTDSLTLLEHYFSLGTGDSRHYAALFQALCNAAGYENEFIEGYFVKNADTDFSRNILHYWNRMRINGIYYYFDCEADSNAYGTEVRNYYFMAAEGNKKWEIWNRDHSEA